MVRADFAPALIACLCYNGSMPDQPEQPILISAAGEAWAQAQRARRKPLAATTIESYCDAWRSFAGWAARQQKRAVAEIGVHDLASWIDSLTHTADGTALTYSHGALAVCKFLADRGLLACDLALLRMHLRDALPRAPAGLGELVSSGGSKAAAAVSTSRRHGVRTGSSGCSFTTRRDCGGACAANEAIMSRAGVSMSGYGECARI